MTDAAQAPPWTAEQAKAFLEKHPALFALMGLLVLMGPRKAAPGWVKDLPPLGGRTAGPWRGKGSFGHGFGSQIGHK